MDKAKKGLWYGVDDFPPIIIAVSAAFQHILIAVTSTISMSYVISDIVCAPLDHPVRSQLFSTSFFMVGLTTLVNSALGIRLPIFQGPSASFLPPLLAMRTAGGWTCPQQVYKDTFNETQLINVTEVNATITYTPDVQYDRLRQLQGSLMLALALEAVCGAFGLVGVMMRLIGPITFSVTISLIGISIYPVSIKFCSAHWGLSILGAVLTMAFSMYMNNIRIPVPSCGKNKGQRTKSSGFPLFLYFPIALSMIIVWIVCAILTKTEVLSSDPDLPEYRARTDTKSRLLHLTPWFYLPHPGQFGIPLFSTATFVGFLASTISSALESVGDYHATSRVCMVVDPPKHAINRGIMVEGVMGVLSGLFGAGHATTSYSGNIAVLGLTKIASRRVLILAGCLAMLMAVVGKIGAVLAMVPDPALGAVTLITYGNLVALGIFSLKNIDFTSSRNLSVFGISLYTAIVIPEWIKDNPTAIDTGNMQVDQIIKVILGTPMFLGSVICIILDNTVKGTPQERGMKKQQEVEIKEDTALEDHISSTDYKFYEIPGISWLQSRLPCLDYLPFLPSSRSKVIYCNENVESKSFNETSGTVLENKDV